MPLAIGARRWGRDDDFSGPQKIHGCPTSRLGGAIIYLAYAVVVLMGRAGGNDAWRPATDLLLAALPVVAVGLVEDFTHRVRPWTRLYAALVSALLASAIAGGTLARVDVPMIDALLAIAPFALLLSWFMVCGICNAVNLIDGVHGLAAGTTALLFIGLAAVAAQVGDAYVLARSLALLGAIAGFMVWNYPRGKVFLGDAGAYFLGFMYAELSIRLVNGNAEVSAWFPVALAAYPIVETLFSIYRRKVWSRGGTMDPDAKHLHSLVFRRLIARSVDASAAHAMVAPRIWLHGLFSYCVAIAFRANTLVLIAFVAMYTLAYICNYRWLSNRICVDAKRVEAGD
jgi:UDP-N-acetylmuramyl pentapeptide phosphotransferase/UDP-N-acetylglucosamine-1-phosphate transferase